MHPQFLGNLQFKRMFLAEAHLAARVRHPNVVPTLDVIVQDQELLIVMEYVHGESLFSLMRACRAAEGMVPLSIACAILVATLQGLDAAHEARDEKGRPLDIVHRDVSPHNVLVGTDGVARVLDFGVAKAVQVQSETNPGTLKGKFSYMAPEAFRGESLTRQADVFSAAVVLWELLAGRKLFNQATEQERVLAVIAGRYPSPSDVNPRVPLALSRVAMTGLHFDQNARYRTALEMAEAIENSVSIASQRLVGAWVSQIAGEVLEQRAELMHRIETSSIVERSSLQNLTSLVAQNPSSVPAVSRRTARPESANARRFVASRWHRLHAVALGSALLAVGLVIVATRLPAPGEGVGPLASRAPQASAAGPSWATRLTPTANSVTPSRGDLESTAPISPPGPESHLEWTTSAGRFEPDAFANSELAASARLSGLPVHRTGLAQTSKPSQASSKAKQRSSREGPAPVRSPRPNNDFLPNEL
jgi:serine/threonine-protein kinase